MTDGKAIDLENCTCVDN